MNSGTLSRPVAHAARPEPGDRDFPVESGPSEPLRIGDLAAFTGVTVETLRYYERRELLRPSGRRASGYREYAPAAVALVRFIKRAQSLGFTLSEVEELVRLRERAWAGDATRLLREAVVAKVGDIDRRIRDLRELGDELGSMIAACDAACAAPVGTTEDDASSGEGSGEPIGNTTVNAADCPLVEALDVDGPGSSRERRPSPGHDRRTNDFEPAGAGTAGREPKKSRRSINSRGGSHDPG